MKIAVDGPAGSGKSTVAKAISKRLGLNYLDTGAMYRTVAYYFLSKNIDVNDTETVNSLIENIDIDLKYIDNIQHMFSEGTDITDKIRTPKISMGASDVSKNHKVRLMLVDMQRNISDKYDIIMDGRDIGTFVIPDADVKFYITASSRERAKRRMADYKGQNISLDEIEQDIIKRDKNDMERDFAPLKKADDAIYIDTTEMTPEEVIAFMTDAINKIK